MTTLSITALEGIPEVRPGDDLATLIGDAVAASPEGLRTGDILFLTWVWRSGVFILWILLVSLIGYHNNLRLRFHNVD